MSTQKTPPRPFRDCLCKASGVVAVVAVVAAVAVVAVVAAVVAVVAVARAVAAVEVVAAIGMAGAGAFIVVGKHLEKQLALTNNNSGDEKYFSSKSKCRNSSGGISSSISTQRVRFIVALDLCQRTLLRENRAGGCSSSP